MPGGALTAGASVSDLHRRSKDHEPSKLLVAGLVVGLLAGAFGIIEAWEAVTNRVVGSKLDEAVITSTGVVGVVHVVHSARGGSHAAYRLTLVEPATGARQGRALIEGHQPHCVESAPGRLWCRTEPELTVFDSASLAIRMDWKALQRAFAPLASGLAPRSGVPETVGDQLLVKTNDGRRWLLGGEPLQATSADRIQSADVVKRRSPSAEPYEVSLSGNRLDFTRNGDRRSLRIIGQAPLEKTYLQPVFLPLHGLDPKQRAFALFVHQTSLRSHDSHSLLTRIDEKGQEAWTVDLGTSTAKFAVWSERTLAVVGNFPDGTIVGLDPATGVERWRTEF